MIVEKLKSLFIDKKLKKNRESIEEYIERRDEVLHKQVVDRLLEKMKIINTDIHVGEDVYSDIEFFSSFSPNKDDNTLFNVMMDMTNLVGGKCLSKLVLSNPLYDTDILESRIRELKAYEEVQKEDDAELWKTLRDNEEKVLWLFEEKEQHIEDLMNIVYFRLFFLRSLNNSPDALTGYNMYRILWSPLIGILSPIVYFLIPYLVLRFKFKFDVDFKTYLKFMYNTFTNTNLSLFSDEGRWKYITMISNFFTLIFYFQGIFNSIEISRTLNKLCNVIIDKFNGVVQFLKAALLLIERHWKESVTQDEYSSIAKAILSKDNEFKFASNTEERKYIEKLKIIKFGLFTNFGKQLHCYKYVKKDIVSSVLVKIYMLDMVRGCLMFKNRHKYCFVEYDKISQKPLTTYKGLRHPCLNPSSVVSNDCKLGHQSIIITGPNAGGKSTFIKSVLINALLSQTVGIATADQCKTTVFRNIMSQINIPDCKGKESLFEAEMHRCSRNLDILSQSNKDNDMTLIIMDEIFNSTNPVEGIAGAYAIAKRISTYDKCLLMFTTHYSYLTKLQKLPSKRFVNYRMNVSVDDTGMITFPYKLERGISKQYIALELLRKNGFDENLITDAIEIKEKLTT